MPTFIENEIGEILNADKVKKFTFTESTDVSFRVYVLTAVMEVGGQETLARKYVPLSEPQENAKHWAQGIRAKLSEALGGIINLSEGLPERLAEGTTEGTTEISDTAQDVPIPTQNTVPDGVTPQDSPVDSPQVEAPKQRQKAGR